MRRFAILSIDAEGVGDRILHAWIEAGFRPEFIIYEAMHNKEELRTSKAYAQLARTSKWACIRPDEFATCTTLCAVPESLRFKRYLSSNGYRFLETRRWNHYFQNIDRDSDTLASAGLGLTDEPDGE